MLKTLQKLLCVMLVTLLSFSTAIVVVSASEKNGDIYTIAMQNTATGDVFSAQAEAGDRYDTVSAYFDGITGGTYDIIVYCLNSEGGNTSTCARTQWTSEAAEGETDSIRVDYYLVTDEINVEVTSVDPGSGDAEGYTIVMQNTDTKETFEAQAEPDEMYDTVSAFFDAIPGGTYDVFVYSFNSEGGNNSLCASTQWTCAAADGEVDTVKVSYYTVTSEINIEITAVHPGTDEPIDLNKLYKAVIKDENGNEVVNEYLNYIDEEGNNYPFYLTVTGLAPGNYTIQIVDNNNNPASDLKEWGYTSDDPNDSVNINILFDSMTSSVVVEELDPEPSANYVVIVEDAQTGELVLTQKMIPDDTHYDTFYSIIEGLKNGSYKISVANFGEIVVTENWNCTTHDKDSLETIEVLYYAATNEMEINDLGTTVTEPDDTDVTSTTDKQPTSNATVDTAVVSSSGTVQTGDATPVAPIILVLMLSTVATVYFVRKRQS